ncbi:MAG: 1,4-alpha-glucan branching enzyme, partial [Nitrospirota bacterium]|nr:1,4-alpha-glucan branching enzyme [Nitrospirota bacterium]
MVTIKQIERLVNAEYVNPYELLGPHQASIEGARAYSVRAFAPDAQEARVILDVPGSHPVQMHRIHDAGLFEAILPKPNGPSRYRLQVTDSEGIVTERHDPYAFAPLISDHDLHLFSEGKLFKAYDTLGSHLRTINGVSGVHFVVWAPNAARVSVVGGFNRWDGRCHPMERRGATGLWELFVPDIPEGTLYKYEIRSQQTDAPFTKADPYAFAGELRPRTASTVRDLSTYQWKDQDWMEARSRINP